MPPHESDERFLRQALDLARAGIGLASPNPYVGAVIADGQGNIVGTGTYTYAGLKHAEILSLEAVGEIQSIELSLPLAQVYDGARFVT